MCEGFIPIGCKKITPKFTGIPAHVMLMLILRDSVIIFMPREKIPRAGDCWVRIPHQKKLEAIEESNSQMDSLVVSTSSSNGVIVSNSEGEDTLTCL